MAGKKVEPEPAKDKALTITSVIGGLLVLASVVPSLPWRVAAANPMLTSRFSGARAYSLFSAGNNFGQPVSWFKMKGDVCKKSQEFNRVNPASALIGTALSALGTGGAVLGCSTWPACKEHTALRCSAYGKLAIVGILSLLLNIIATVAAFVVLVMKSQEAQVKKKKKQLKAAMSTTMTTAIVAFGCSFFSVNMWWFVSDMTFKSLQNNAFFPYPAIGVGVYIAGVGTFLLFVGMVCAILRVKEKEEAGSADEPEEYAADDGPGDMPMQAAMLMPGMGMGPPGMGPPGMGPPMPPVA